MDRCLEQPLKTPFVAATILYANETKAEVAAETISRAGEMAQQAVMPSAGIEALLRQTIDRPNAPLTVLVLRDRQTEAFDDIRAVACCSW